MGEESQGDALPKFVLRGPQKSSLTIYLHGAHVTSWKDLDGKEQLFVSKDAVFKPPKAIRGGIPVCFPQFGTLGPLNQHGFARNKAFSVVSATLDSAVLQLVPDEEDLAKFPHSFALTVTVQIKGNSILQKVHVENTGTSAFNFTTALHTYIQIPSVEEVTVMGLKGLEYFDNTDGVDGKLEEETRVSIKAEIDRIYKSAPEHITIDDGSGRQISLTKEGFPDVVVWNPWTAKAKGMSDFGDQEYKVMVCLEPALAKSNPVALQPGSSWKAQQELRVSKL